MPKLPILVRYSIFLTGLFFMGLGVSLTTKANLGTSPISSVSYVLSLKFPITFGQFTFLLTLLFFLIEWIILRKEFPKEQYLQVFVAYLLGIFVDIGMNLFSFLDPFVYYQKIIVLLLGCLVLALGVYLQVSANVIINPGEGVVKAIAVKTGRKFGSVKVMFDCTLVLIAVILSFAFFGSLNGLREGTFISALLVGQLTKLYDSILIQLNLKARFENS